MATQDKALLPYRDYDEHDVINEFALTATGLAGQLVKVSTSVPDNENYWSANAVGASYDKVISNLFENPNKVAVATTGDTKYTILGITLCDTLTHDANGNNLVTANPRGLAERGAVYLGQTVPVAQRGKFSMRLAFIEGVPTPGKVVVPPTGAGKFLAAVDASAILATGSPAAGSYKPEQVLGRWVTNTGSRQGGYADFTINI
jgi:hypothetical protein